MLMVHPGRGMEMKVSSGLVYVSLIVVVLFSASLSHTEIPLENLAGAWVFDKDAGDTVKERLAQP